MKGSDKMKRLVAMFVVIVLCFGLCACSTTAPITSEQKTPNKDTYVGVWVSTSSKYEGILPHSIRLLSNGQALLLDTDSYLVDEAPVAMCGEWILEGEQIIVFFYCESDALVSRAAYTFNISSPKEIVMPGFDVAYKKK